ncbi:hypothetical protein PYCCODRAFT_1093760 [Trametes coccinea BRFM310]|uniref:Uncharacterized protein n=1 Tax=Trametes coccinea (strain BRFM310) TaxID=1353009 RepID=A0A1Y2IZY6_TRAC3|nr:hypothetical protein PYCCODRAFT_1093760 [Trametes coccinea BRFM310]
MRFRLIGLQAMQNLRMPEFSLAHLIAGAVLLQPVVRSWRVVVTHNPLQMANAASYGMRPSTSPNCVVPPPD